MTRHYKAGVVLLALFVAGDLAAGALRNRRQRPCCPPCICVPICPPAITNPPPIVDTLPKRPARSTEWKCFGGGPSRNMVNVIDRDVPISWEVRQGEEAKNLKWVAKLGSRAYGGPVISGGKVFVGTNNESPRNPRDIDPRRINSASKKPVPLDKGVLMCFRESDGEFLWQHVSDKQGDPIAHEWFWQGIGSTPSVEGNRLWYVTDRYEVICLDIDGFANGNQGALDEKYRDYTDADVIWRYDMRQELGVFPRAMMCYGLVCCSPLVVGDLVFVVTGNGVDETLRNVAAPDAPSFIALNKKSGRLVWKDNSPGKNIMHGQWSSPAYGEIDGVPQVIFPGGDGWLRAFEPQTGRPLWQCDCNRKKTENYRRGGENERNHFVSAPVIYDGKIYIGMGRDLGDSEGPALVWCIDAAGKSGDISPELVTKEDADFTKRQTQPNPNSGALWSYGGLDPRPDPDLKQIFGRTIGTCAVHDGLVYVTEVSGYLHCLDAATGKVCWVHDLRSELFASPYWVDGKIYLNTTDGDVFIFEHGRKMKQLAKIEMDASIRSTPIVVNGVLYIMTEQNLYAIQKK